MDDWYTVRQAAVVLEISTQRVYALIAAGTLAARRVGSVRLVSRRSVALYKESPTRNKFAGGNLRPVLYTSDELELNGQGTLEDGWTGLFPPSLSDEARRLYDASPEGLREQRLTDADPGRLIV